MDEAREPWIITVRPALNGVAITPAGGELNGFHASGTWLRVFRTHAEFSEWALNYFTWEEPCSDKS